MALTADIVRDNRGASVSAPDVLASEIIYSGGYAAIGGVSHGTAANIGRAFAFNDAAGSMPGGFAKLHATGNAAAPRVTTTLDWAGQIVEVPVTGLAGDNTDVLKMVYASDDTTFTFTRTAVNMAIGFVEKFISSTLAAVYFFSVPEMAILCLAGGDRNTWHLCSSTYEFAASSDLVKGLIAPCHGRILAVYAICSAAPQDADVAADAVLEIGGTDVTGGVVSFAAADTVGLKLAGTAVTAENVFHMGDLIDVETTVGAAGTLGDGMFSLYVDYEPLLGL